MIIGVDQNVIEGSSITLRGPFAQFSSSSMFFCIIYDCAPFYDPKLDIWHPKNLGLS